MDIAKKIHDLRISRDLTLEQVGDYVGVSKATVLKWESGKIKNMRRDKIVRLAEILGTTPGELIGWTTEPAPENPLPALESFPLTPHEKRLVTAYRDNPPMQPAVCRLLGIPDESADQPRSDPAADIIETLRELEKEGAVRK